MTSKKKTSALIPTLLSDTGQSVSFVVPQQQQIQVQQPNYPDSGVRYEGYYKKFLSNQNFILKKQYPYRYNTFHSSATSFNTARALIPIPTGQNLFIQRLFIHAAGTKGATYPYYGAVEFEQLLNGGYVQIAQYLVTNDGEINITFECPWAVLQDLFFILDNTGATCLTQIEIWGFTEDI
jgi:hypothetical protein